MLFKMNSLEVLETFFMFLIIYMTILENAIADDVPPADPYIYDIIKSAQVKQSDNVTVDFYGPEKNCNVSVTRAVWNTYSKAHHLLSNIKKPKYGNDHTTTIGTGSNTTTYIYNKKVTPICKLTTREEPNLINKAKKGSTSKKNQNPKSKKDQIYKCELVVKIHNAKGHVFCVPPIFCTQPYTDARSKSQAVSKCNGTAEEHIALFRNERFVACLKNVQIPGNQKG